MMRRVGVVICLIAVIFISFLYRVYYSDVMFDRERWIRCQKDGNYRLRSRMIDDLEPKLKHLTNSKQVIELLGTPDRNHQHLVSRS